MPGAQIYLDIPTRVLSLKPKPEVDFRLYGRHLEKSILRHNSTVRLSVLIKFGTSMQNAMPMTMNKPKSKQEVLFQYGRRPHSQIRSRNNTRGLRYLIET